MLRIIPSVIYPLLPLLTFSHYNPEVFNSFLSHWLIVFIYHVTIEHETYNETKKIKKNISNIGCLFT